MYFFWLKIQPGFLIKNLMAALILLTALNARAQKKWDGEGMDGQWTTAVNWSDDLVPESNDSIILDHSIVPGSYKVWLPPGNTGIAVNKIFINPGAGADSIYLIIPQNNTASPALTIGSGGLKLSEGACLINASGALNGTAISVADSIYLENGSVLVHQSKNAHAAYVGRLSRQTGTEKGLFVFDVPGTASYTISLSNRVYGSLHLLSAASVTGRTYVSSGVNKSIIRGDLLIGEKVNYSLDYAGTIEINGGLMVDGMLNLDNDSNNNRVILGGNLFCRGLITETSAGVPTIECSGSSLQMIEVAGRIQNQVALRLNNPAGILLKKNLSLPHSLELKNGPLFTHDSALLIIDSTCMLLADSLHLTAFINGPVRVKGLQQRDRFLFPVGKQGKMRWLSLKDTDGEVTVEYFRNNPQSFSTVLDTALSHLSALEYWRIKPTANSHGIVQLSFDDLLSGGVTDLFSLRVARLKNNRWENAGNLSTTGSAGASGTVTSQSITMNPDEWEYLALASSQSAQNPLPIQYTVNYQVFRDYVEFGLLMNKPPEIEVGRGNLVLEWSEGGSGFHKVESVQVMPDNNGFRIKTERPGQDGYFRIRTMRSPENEWLSDIFPVKGRQKGRLESSGNRFMIRLAGRGLNEIWVKVEASPPVPVRLFLIDMKGKIVCEKLVIPATGNQIVSLQIGHLASGIYRVFGVSSSLRTTPVNFFKP